jgi:hypothetical protein
MLIYSTLKHVIVYSKENVNLALYVTSPLKSLWVMVHLDRYEYEVRLHRPANNLHSKLSVGTDIV